MLEEMIVNGLKDYGAIGIMLAYFLWKDSKTFELYRTTMKEIVTEIKTMREEQGKLKCDVDAIKEILGKH